MEGETDMPMVPLSWLADHVDVPEGTDAEALAAALLAQDSGNAETYKAAMQSLLELSKYLTPNDKLLYQSLLAENE